MTRKRVLFWGLLASLIAVGVASMGGYLWRRANEPATSAAPGESGSPVLPPLARDAWPIGQERSYRTALTTTVMRKAQGHESKLLLDAELELRLVAVAHDPREVTVQGELRASKLRVGSPGAMEDRAGTSNQKLTRPFAFTLDARGAVTKLHLDRELDALGEGLVRALVSGHQLVLPEDARAGSWSAPEHDSTGRLTAGYRRISEHQLTKATLAYADDPASLIQSERERKVTARLERRPDGILKRADRSEEQSAKVNELDMESKTRLELELTAVRTTTVTALDLTKLRATRLDETAVSPHSDRSRLEQLARGHDLNATIASLTRPGISEAESRELSQRLAALIALGGERGAELAERAARSAKTTDDALTMIGALRNAASKDAQHSLAELARDKQLAEEVRVASLMGLGSAEAPTADTFEDLRQIAQDEGSTQHVRDTSLRALGAALAQNDGSDPGAAAAADAASGYLIDGLERARTPAEASVYADALGNSGRLEALEPLSQMMQEKNSSLRATAIQSMRRIDDPQVDAAIAQVLRHDSDPMVKSSALFALRYRELTSETLSALVHVVKTEPDKHVRHEAVGVAAMFADTWRELSDLIKWVSVNDPDEDIRRLAAQTLASDAQHGPPPGTLP